jgi:hypothetical protein
MAATVGVAHHMVNRVIIDGSLTGGGTGFVLGASHSVLRGLIITGFGVGVSVPAADAAGNPILGDLIQGNFIGDYVFYPVDPQTGSPLTGDSAVGFKYGPANSLQGVVLNSSNCTVGGSNPQEMIVICGNGQQGIWIRPGASGNQVLGNQIGMAGPWDNNRYVQDGNRAEGVLITSAGNLADPLNISYASSNFIGSASGGNVISANCGAGIHLVGVGANRTLIQGNQIGVAPGGGYLFGTGNPGNLGDGVWIDEGSQNLVGGTDPKLGNVISSNALAGVRITGPDATGNIVANNVLGLASAGTQVAGNAQEGVAVYSPGNTIGPHNVISQNLRGIGIYGPTGTRTLVNDNLIGTDVTGQQGLGNAIEGVRIDNSAANTIQGNAKGSQVISSNQQGIALIGSSSAANLVAGNLIGSDSTGMFDLGNKGDGILISGAVNNTIGGNFAAAQNLISANHRGIRLDGATTTGNVVQRNDIGTDITGTAPLGNELYGVVFDHSASGNTIGGATTELGNVIAFHVSSGVLVLSGTGDSILSNSIFRNGRLGIDLAAQGDPASGVTPNHAAHRVGPNNLQNAPVLIAAVGGGPTGIVQGTLNSSPSTTFTIQFFQNQVEDPSGFGQGQTWIGSTVVTTDPTGKATVSFASKTALPLDSWISATATDTNTGDTSEFSNDVSPQAVSVEFASATSAVDASAGSTLIHVHREGNAQAVISVTYATSDGTAVAGKDYTATSGRLTFQVGETDKTFQLFVLSNLAQTASSVTVNMGLSIPTGGATLGTLSSSVLSINNNLPPILQFKTATFSAYSTTTSVLVTVTRGGGSRGTPVSVSYATLGGSAAPGVDYSPASGTLSFLANQPTATFSVRLVPGSHPSGTATVGLVLSNPTGGATMGALNSATLKITTLASGPSSPSGPVDSIPPRITGQQLQLGPAGVTGIVFAFSEPLNPTRAQDLSNYGYFAISSGPDGRFGTADDSSVPLSGAWYDSTSRTVALTLSSPVPFNRFARITIDALANPLLGRGVVDLSGNLLSGAGNGSPGGAYIATFGVGTGLKYTDAAGKTVQLSLTGGGLIQVFRAAGGDPQSIALIGAVPRKSVLSLHADNRGNRSTYLPPIQGASGVKLRYRTPPITFRSSPLFPAPLIRAKPAQTRRPR